MALSDSGKGGETKKILILFHSGSGSTRTVSEVFRKKLSKSYTVDMIQVSPNPDYQVLSKYDFLLFGFPTYHCRPSTSIMEYVGNMPSIGSLQTAFVFTTCGLYTGNGLRMLIKKLQEKRIITIGYLEIRGPASDGALLYPSSLLFMFEYEKRAGEKIEKAVSGIEDSLRSHTTESRIPAYKWYVPINNVGSFFGERVYNGYRDGLCILSDVCTNCNLCVKNCERGCWTKGEEQPSFTPMNCEFCLECVHNCPKKAIIFSEKMKGKPRLNKAFYRRLKAGLLGD